MITPFTIVHQQPLNAFQPVSLTFPHPLEKAARNAADEARTAPKLAHRKPSPFSLV